MTPSVPARNSFSFQFFFSFFFIGLFLFGVAFPDHFASGWVLTEFVDTLAVCYLLEEKVADCKRTNETTTSSLFRKFPFGYEFLTQIGGSLLSSFVPNVFIRPCVSLGAINMRNWVDALPFTSFSNVIIPFQYKTGSPFRN